MADWADRWASHGEKLREAVKDRVLGGWAPPLPLPLSSIYARERAASGGPWSVDLEHKRSMLSGGRYFPSITDAKGDIVAPLLAPRYNISISRENAEFIAFSRRDVPDLLREVDRLKAGAMEAAMLLWVAIDTGLLDHGWARDVAVRLAVMTQGMEEEADA